MCLCYSSSQSTISIAKQQESAVNALEKVLARRIPDLCRPSPQTFPFPSPPSSSCFPSSSPLAAPSLSHSFSPSVSSSPLSPFDGQVKADMCRSVGGVDLSRSTVGFVIGNLYYFFLHLFAWFYLILFDSFSTAVDFNPFLLSSPSSSAPKQYDNRKNILKSYACL